MADASLNHRGCHQLRGVGVDGETIYAVGSDEKLGTAITTTGHNYYRVGSDKKLGTAITTTGHNYYRVGSDEKLKRP